jgi:DnaJ-class molecular chaperone
MQNEEGYKTQSESEDDVRSLGNSVEVLLQTSEEEWLLVIEIEQKCEDCVGSGYDRGSLRPTDPEECPACQGSGKQTIVRDYLAEALSIAVRKSTKIPDREHLQAIIKYYRSRMGAVTE